MWKVLYLIMRALIFHYPRMAMWVVMQRMNITKLLCDEGFLKMQTLAFADEPFAMPWEGGGINSLINWQTLFWKSDLPQICSDRFAVRDYIRSKGYGEYLVPLLPNESSVWDDPDDIDFEALPNSFVLKCTNASGLVMIVKDKSKLDVDKARETMREWLANDFASLYRELQYSRIKNRIICEKFIETKDGLAPNDYKIMCSDGSPIYGWVDVDRFGNHTRMMVDPKFRCQDCRFALDRPSNWEDIRPPKNWDKMLEIASALSQDIPLVRVDMYEEEGVLHIGEITFTTEGAIGLIRPFSYSQKWARQANLSKFISKA